MSSLVTSLDKEEGQGWIVTTAGGDILQSEKVVLCQVQRCFIRNTNNTNSNMGLLSCFLLLSSKTVGMENHYKLENFYASAFNEVFCSQ